jgi:hypothetical protein
MEQRRARSTRLQVTSIAHRKKLTRAAAAAFCGGF